VTDDFVTRLGHLLREAADREEQRTAAARAVLTARARTPRIAGLQAVVALALGAALLVAILGLAPASRKPAKSAGPEVVARLFPGGALVQVAPGFGSAWVLDTTNDTLTRMNPATRRGIATIGLRAAVAADVGRDAVWVTEGLGDVAQIDPQTDRLVARIRLPQGTSSKGVPVAVGNMVWVVDPERALRIDARTNRVTRAVNVAHDGYDTRGAVQLGGDLWVLVSDGHIVRLDGHTGALKATFRTPFLGALAVYGGSLYVQAPGHLARVDPATGRTLWRLRLDQLGAGTEAGGLLWLEAAGHNGDGLVAVDPRNGHVVTSVDVGAFGVTSVASIGSELWLGTASGHLLVVRR
jgi:outer membrane protein assembly factor BamB